MDPHGRGGEEHDVHALLAIHGGQGFAQHEHIAEQEGADELAGHAIDDLGVDLGFRITGEIEQAELAGVAGPETPTFWDQ